MADSIDNLKTMVSESGKSGGYTLSSGDKLGQYRIVRPLGKGGMGEVYEVEHTTLERRYALKLLPSDFAAQPGALERFRREAKVMANLDHPNILKVDDFGEANGRYWLRMELANGGTRGGQVVRTLQEYVRVAGGILPEDEALLVFDALMGGLAYAHSQGVIHGDLKPDNVLVFTDADGYATFKIADFGLARVFGATGLHEQIEATLPGGINSIGTVPTIGTPESAEKALVGTLAYMSPEQKRGDMATPASDVYAFGLIIYRMITGRQELGLELPSQIQAPLSKGWDSLLLKALAEKPADRWKDGRQLLAAFTLNVDNGNSATEPKPDSVTIKDTASPYLICSDKSLNIQFPHIGAELQALGEEYIDEMTPRLISADIVEVFDKVTADGYYHVPRNKMAFLRNEVINAPSLRRVERFAGMVRGFLKNNMPDLEISFQRTLRIPDDGKLYPLPPDLDNFPLRQVEDLETDLPEAFLQRGGVVMPMFPSEAMWIRFKTQYPFAIKIGTGTLNVVNGQPWGAGLPRSPQGYIVLPEQLWLDGYCVRKGEVRQFVATPMGKGYSAAEQLLENNQSGLQIEIFPLKLKCYFERILKSRLPNGLEAVVTSFLLEMGYNQRSGGLFSMESQAKDPNRISPLGLGAGGRLKQQVYADKWAEQDWEKSVSVRAWVHLCNAADWKYLTGDLPPYQPLSADDYNRAGFPWFDDYRCDLAAIEGSSRFAKLKSVFSMARSQHESVPADPSFKTPNITKVHPDKNNKTVSQWDGNI